MKFSVITVCRNNLAGLRVTYRGVIEQTFQDYEWIVIDGASTDGSVEWLQVTLETGPARLWMSEPDAGLFDAMNKGLDQASGDYVIFMNGGDTFAEPTVLERVAEAIDRTSPKADFLYGDSVDITGEGVGLYREAKPHATLWRGMFTQHQAMFFSSTRIADLRFPLEFQLSADYSFICSFLKESHASSPPRAVKLTFPICYFALGGLGWVRRIEALSEGFRIRRAVLRQPLWLNASLYALHRLHTYLKRAAPSITRRIRYRTKAPINSVIPSGKDGEASGSTDAR